MSGKIDWGNTHPYAQEAIKNSSIGEGGRLRMSIESTNHLLNLSNFNDTGKFKIDEFLNMLSFQETNNRNIYQENRRHDRYGAGYFQMEAGKDHGGYTILNTAFNGLPNTLKPGWLNDLNKKGGEVDSSHSFDATVLDYDKQSYILMSWILYGKTERATKARNDFFELLKNDRVKQSEVKEWWMNHWNKSKGHKKRKRLNEWDDKFKEYQPKNSSYYDSADVMMQQMINEDNPLRM